MGNLGLRKTVSVEPLESGVHLTQDCVTERLLGEGSFGRVYKCHRESTSEPVAVKIISGDKQAAKDEIRAMKHLRRLDCEKYNLVKFFEDFKYKGSYGLVFENLHTSLYDYLKERDFKPLAISEIRVIGQQMLEALSGLKSLKLTHCDIKIDNIMLASKGSLRVKLIDFGLACLTSKLWQGCIMQNPSYRALEIFLGLPLDEGVDMWSLGTALVDLYLCDSLIPEDESEALATIVDLFGMPDNDLLKKGLYTGDFFTRVQKHPAVWKLKSPNKENISKEWWLARKVSNPAECKDVAAFVDLLGKMMCLDPKKRITPTEALGHTFITMKHLSAESDSEYLIHANKAMIACGLQSATKPDKGTSDELRSLEATTAKIIEKPPSTNIPSVTQLRPKTPSEVSCSTSGKTPASCISTIKAKLFALLGRNKSPPSQSEEVKIKELYYSSSEDSDSDSSSENLSSSRVKRKKRKRMKKCLIRCLLCGATF